jgi:hypothetical protein
MVSTIMAIQDKIPVYEAPVGGQLTDEMVRAFHESGVLVLRKFVSTDACRELKQRTD